MTRPRRILHTLCRVASGGVEQRLPLMLDFLPPDEFVHEVICQDTSGALAASLRERGVVIHEIGAAPSLLDPRWYRRALPPARRFDPDIIHGGVIEGNALANMLGIALPKVRVISEETSHPMDRKWRTERFLQLLMRRSDAVIGVSPAVTAYLRERLAIPQAKLRTIGNGVRPAPIMTDDDHERLRAELGLPAGAAVIGAVGRIEESSKHFSDLIRALPAIRASCPNAHGLIVGDGEDLPWLKALADSLAVSEAVTFAGYRGDTRPLYPLMDVFVLPSITEAFGLVLTEAMLAGVPVVGTRVGGIPWVIDDGRAGRLVDPRSPDQIAAAVIALLNDPAARHDLGEAGRRYANAHFSAERYATDIARLYRDLSHAR